MNKSKLVFIYLLNVQVFTVALLNKSINLFFWKTFDPKLLNGDVYLTIFLIVSVLKLKFIYLTSIWTIMWT